jgi:hypothetical protein
MDGSLIHFEGDSTDMAIRQSQASATTKIQHLYYRYTMSDWVGTSRTFNFFPGSDNVVTMRILSCFIKNPPTFVTEVHFMGWSTIDDDSPRDMQNASPSMFIGLVGSPGQNTSTWPPTNWVGGIVTNPAVKGKLPPGPSMTWDFQFYNAENNSMFTPEAVCMVLEVVG